MSTLSIHAPSPASDRPRLFGQLAGGLALLALAGALLFGGDRHGHAPASPSENRLVRWQDSRHDWLLVADRAAHQLVVYDAATGAPLQRLGERDGVGEVDSIAQLGDLLLVQDVRGEARVLGMPGLQPRALASR
ncbi:hypothetical protein [Dyella sp.]|jgi:hypothetical protein|uniref:hypothetical protein n=1 Tax=Dyella sp. TaxID=1869338 RepID=UPI002D79A045|nr:hypothetical protein [Dyella sp.]HET6432226.1 hypothetical protein [Dyella sp.]